MASGVFHFAEPRDHIVQIVADNFPDRLKKHFLSIHTALKAIQPYPGET
jgi:hypothetical protein